MKNFREIKNERKSRKRGLWYSIGFHTVILALLLFPFFKNVTSADEYEDIIMVDFSGSSLKGSSGASAAAAAEESPKRETEVIERISSNPPPKVLTADESPVKVPEVLTTAKKEHTDYDKSPVVLETNKKSPTINTPKTKIDVPLVEIPLPPKEGGGASVGDDDSGTSGSGAVAGTEDVGSGNADSGSGKSDSGTAEDNSGSGLFGEIGELKRAVIYRPNVAAMIKETSVIKVRLCVSRSGHVIDYAFEPEGSVVSDPSLIEATLGIVGKYKFEPVTYGPVLECGIYTIRVDMSHL